MPDPIPLLDWKTCYSAKYDYERFPRRSLFLAIKAAQDLKTSLCSKWGSEISDDWTVSEEKYTIHYYHVLYDSSVVLRQRLVRDSRTPDNQLLRKVAFNNIAPLKKFSKKRFLICSIESSRLGVPVSDY